MTILLNDLTIQLLIETELDKIVLWVKHGGAQVEKFINIIY